MHNNLIIVSAVWCPSCLILKKQLKKIKEEFNIDYIMYDYDLDEDIVKEYEVGNKLPVIIYNDKRLIGEKTDEELELFLKECNLI